jgi:mannose-6-phosphate isomerase-like protein (cupin superfamily)
MSGYTIVNMKTDVDDQGPNFGLAPDFEARFARVPLEAELIGITYQRLAPNFRLRKGHHHKTQEEVYVLVDGTARAKLGDEVRELKPWDAVRVHKDTVRSFEAGPEGAVFIAVGCPGGPGDAVDVEGFWDQEEG